MGPRQHIACTGYIPMENCSAGGPTPVFLLSVQVVVKVGPSPAKKHLLVKLGFHLPLKVLRREELLVVQVMSRLKVEHRPHRLILMVRRRRIKSLRTHLKILHL